MRIKASLDCAKPGDILDLKKENGQWFLCSGETKAPVTGDELASLGREQYKAICGENGEAKVVRFADLHRHSDYSLKDGLSKVKDLAKFTECAGALTDHGNMYGFLDYYKAMTSAGKKPILGFEAYFEDAENGVVNAHLVLLAKNEIGVKNLFYLTSEAFEHFYKKPQVTWEMLESHHDGVIALSACCGGIPQEFLKKDKPELAKAAILRFKALFGDDYYVEIQRHHFPEEEAIMREMGKLADELGVKKVATTDSHYTKREDAKAHECLLCLQSKSLLTEPHWSFPGDGYFIHSSEDMEKLFGDMPDALDNTLEVADKCDVVLDLDQRNMPKFPVPAPFTDDDSYFEHLCREGWTKRFAGKPEETNPEYLKRFDYELAMIKQMGFVSYFLIVQDYINWAREHGIYVGPGRGSAAGSLISYCIGITDLDPIKYALLFERFLNPERVSMPDIDTDFEHTRRQEVLDYVASRYGSENVCRIVTFGTMAAKQSVKDVARVMGYPVSKGIEITKMIPGDPRMTLDKALKQNPEFKDAYDNDPDTKRIVDMAMIMEGCKRNSSVHACGNVIAPGAVRQYLPVSKELDEETGLKVTTSMVVGPEVEELSLLKMDFLGLKNMTVIHEVLNNVARTRGVHMDYHDIPLNDRETYEMLRDGGTGGVFQLESPGMTSVVQQMLSDLDTIPDAELDSCFERIIAAVALYRPGPMDFIPDYVAGMRDARSIHYDHPMLESILKNTFGTIVYQEQVMQIVQKLGGYTLGRADIVRKAMGKKKKAVMDAEREVFIYGNEAAMKSGKDKVAVPGCIKNGVPEETAVLIWSKMEKFAEYAFNRSHAACYAWISVITAYMRCHWAPEFYAAMCNAFYENSDKLIAYLVQAHQNKIEILPPDINASVSGFVSENGKDIRYGFSGLKGVKALSERIVDERTKNGAFTSPYDFFHRMNLRDEKANKTALESLTWSGAFDCFGLTRASISAAWDKIVAVSDGLKKAYNPDQFSFFDENEDEVGDVEIVRRPEASVDVLMEKEKDAVGFYLTHHPTDLLQDLIDKKKVCTVSEIPENAAGSLIVTGMVGNVRTLYTKKDGRKMFTMTIADKYSEIRCVVFPDQAAEFSAEIYDGNIVQIAAELKSGDDEERQLIARSVMGKENIVSKPMNVTVIVPTKAAGNGILAYAKEHRGESIMTIICEENNAERRIRVDYTVAWAESLRSNYRVSYSA